MINLFSFIKIYFINKEDRIRHFYLVFEYIMEEEALLQARAQRYERMIPKTKEMTTNRVLSSTIMGIQL